MFLLANLKTDWVKFKAHVHVHTCMCICVCLYKDQEGDQAGGRQERVMDRAVHECVDR